MNFELLPNKILLEIFRYFHVADLLHSFDQLNAHFSTLIRNIPLRFDFSQMTKSTFGQFCQLIFSRREFHQRIVYLQLSNDGTLGQIESFLSIFSLKDFANLRSLSLLNLTANNTKQLLPMLPFLSNLRSLSVSGEKCNSLEILSALTKVKLQHLSISHIKFPSNLRIEPMRISSLIISKFNSDLSNLLALFPRLKSLKIECLDEVESIVNNKHLSLKELLINECKMKLEKLEIFLKALPNLRILSIFIDHDKNVFDAARWQTLIESSLKHLSVFKFDFRYDQSRNFSEKLSQFQGFQTDFWRKQHQWLTNLEISSHFLTIYTIPYARNHYEFTRDINLYGYQSINNSNVFDNVQIVSLSAQRIQNHSQYYFPNVQTLKLENDYDDDDNDDEQDVKDLHRIVNVSNIKHLIIDQEADITPVRLVDLLQQLPNVSSLSIDEYNIMQMKLFNQTDLCKSLNERIKILDISTDECLDEKLFPKQIHLIFSKAFSNLKQFRCDYIKDVGDLLAILKQCPKLSLIKSQAISKSVQKWIGENAARLNLYLDFQLVNEDDDDDEDEFSDEE